MINQFLGNLLHDSCAVFLCGVPSQGQMLTPELVKAWEELHMILLPSMDLGVGA